MTIKLKFIPYLMVSTLTFCFVSASFAQNGFTPIERRVADRALTTLEDYEINARLADKIDKYAFEDLFVSSDLQIFNDILQYPEGGPTLPINEYINHLMHALNTEVDISEIRRSRIWLENDSVWKTEYTFKKTIKCNDYFGNKQSSIEKPIYFWSKDFYGTEYDMTAVLFYDQENDRCKIESLTGSINSDKKLENGFYTFRITDDKRDARLTYNKQPMDIDSVNGQAFIANNVTKKMFRYPDYDVALHLNADPESRIVTMKYKPRRVSFRPYCDFGCGSSLTFDSPNGLDSYKASSSGWGINLGISFPSKSSTKISLITGVGITTTNLDFSYSNTDYCYATVQDVNASGYIRHYKGLRISQSTKLSELTIPLIYDCQISFNQILSMYIDWGAIFNHPLSYDINTTEGSAYIYGVYPQYDNLYMDEQWGFNGFGKATFSNSNLFQSTLPNISKWNIDAMGGGGFRITIPQTFLSLELGASYRFGLLNIINENPRPVDLANNCKFPLVFNKVNGLDSKEIVRSLTESVGNVKRRLFQIHIGINYKF